MLVGLEQGWTLAPGDFDGDDLILEFAGCLSRGKTLLRAQIDTGSAGQPLLGHGGAVPSGCCGDGSDEPSWSAAENHQVVFTAFSVGPMRRMALLDRLLVVNVSGEKFDDLIACPP